MEAVQRCLALVLVMLLPGAVEAGAWMRTVGETFLSFGLDIEEENAVQTVFAETGIAPRLTLGIDAWRSGYGDWSALAVANVPVGSVDSPAKKALSVGAGAVHAGGKIGPQLRLGAHFGRGLADGWLAADLTATHRFADKRTVVKATGTYGRNISNRCSLILEARAETRAPVTLAPSLACRLSPGLLLRAGGAVPLTGRGGPPKLSVQTWIEF